ncbi:MAG TPA: protein kinase [Vicinamibacteria bacterium]|nr:protein kinase [Vicinamibacteria bacterium]
MVSSPATMERQQIGKYRILGKIGQGAMGEVFKAQDPVLNRFVAIKTISGGMAPESDLRKRFLREAQSAARLSHPNIITVFDFGEEQDRVFMAMELLEGIDLKEAIRARTLATLDDQLAVMEQICDGLAFAHAKGVVHRDIKPANLHIQPDGNVKIMDFGLARLGESEMTATGMILGTPHYMSPEQVRGEKADARSDVFSLGAVFYELLAYHKAFDADSMHSILFQVLEHQPAPLRRFSPDLPPALVAAVEKALEKDATRRFQHGGEMRDAVRAIRRALRTGEDSAALQSLSGASTLSASRAGSPSQDEAPTYPPTSRSAAASRSALARQLDPSASGAAPEAAYAQTVLSQSQAGASGSRSGSRSVRAAAPPPSRVPLMAGIGVLAVTAAGVAGFFVLRGSSAPPPPASVAAGGDQLGALTEALVTSQLELARRNLDDKQYDSAARQAEQILKLDAANSGAQQVLAEAQARLAEVDTAAAEARRAMDAGQATQAAAALTRVLALDPRHAVAAELSDRLNRHFQGQSAEARRMMAAAREAATRARAESVRPFPEAVTLATEADVLHRRAEYAVAAQKFMESRDRFEQARRTAVAQAEVQAARAAAAPPVTRPAVATAPPVPEPTAAPVAATPPPAPATPPPAAPTPVPRVNEEPAIRRVIADYERAIETRDLALFRTVKPNLSGQEERTLRATFAQVRSHQIEMTLGPIEVDGREARVQLTRDDTIDGKPFQFQQTLVLVKDGGAWTIREIGR